MKYLAATLILALGLAFCFTACKNEEYSARKKLADLYIPFSALSFAERIYEGDTLAVDLFLKAGFDPSSKAHMTRWLSNPDEDFEHWKKSVSSADERTWKIFLTSGDVGGTGFGGIAFRPIFLPLLTMAKIKARDKKQNYSYIYDRLLESGASVQQVSLAEEIVRQDLEKITDRVEESARSNVPDIARSPAINRDAKQKLDEMLLGGSSGTERGRR